MRGVLISLALILTTSTAVADQTGNGPAGKPLPKLVLFMVIDGFPQEQFVKYYDQYTERGFKLLLDKGGWYGNNHYSHATTYTGVGHATLLSCAHPYKHGVVGNDWIDKKTGRRLYSTEDARFKYLDEETPDHSGTSPFNMKVTTVGDELIYANGKSKVITIAGKDRSAIGLAGQYGTAYMHSATTGRFITSNYYMEDYPDWWKRFYESKPQHKYFKETWSLLLPEEPMPARLQMIGHGPRSTRTSGRAFPIRLSAAPKSRVRLTMMR
jgi:predicted AlkP superfamily pyrophosphatase or phosphodiesterase